MRHERIIFRVFDMPCCHIQICWVNHRLPNFCPECGARTFYLLKMDSSFTLFRDENAWIKYSEKKENKNARI